MYTDVVGSRKKQTQCEMRKGPMQGSSNAFEMESGAVHFSHNINAENKADDEYTASWYGCVSSVYLPVPSCFGERPIWDKLTDSWVDDQTHKKNVAISRNSSIYPVRLKAFNLSNWPCCQFPGQFVESHMTWLHCCPKW